MYDTKSMWTSKAVWGGIIAFIAALAALFGYTFSEADQAQLTDIIVAIGGAVGGVLAIWGRITATKKIG